MESACKQASYVSSKMPLPNTAAIAAYEKTLCVIFIYKYVVSYCRVSIIDIGKGGGGGVCGGTICGSEICTGRMSEQMFMRSDSCIDDND